MLAIRSLGSRIFTTSRTFETSDLFANARQFSARRNLGKRGINFSLVVMIGVSNRISVLAWIVMYIFAGQGDIPWNGISDNGMQAFGSSIFRLTDLSFTSQESFSRLE